jgi:hypothetical protein
MRKEIWVMPEEKDETFSLALVERIYNIAKSLKVEAFTIEISEKYVTEENPHFHMKAGFGLCIDLPGDRIRVGYTASANNTTYGGIIQIEVRAEAPSPIGIILVAMAFGLYDEAIRQFYPEWTTDYNINNILLS